MTLDLSATNLNLNKALTSSHHFEEVSDEIGRGNYVSHRISD